MALDFKANQIRTSQIIASGSTTGASLVVYGPGAAADFKGGIFSAVTASVGSDVFIYVSGSTGSKNLANSRGTSLFGGDVVVSGTITSASGLSGSLTKLADGTSYLVQGSNITISTGTNGQVTISSTGGGTPGGSDTYVQFNDGGSFGGDAGLAYNKTTDSLTVAGGITGSNLYISNNAIVQGNLTVNGTTTTVNTVNLLVRDPVVLIGSGSITSNSDGGIALASGSSDANKALVWGRVANDTWGAGKLDVQNGSVTSVSTMDLVNIRAAKYEIGGTSTGLTSSDGQNVTIYSGGSSFINIVPGSTGLKLGNSTAPVAISGSEVRIGSEVPAVPGNDTFLFVSGAIRSRGTSTKGTAVFGGDLFVSGTITSALGLSGSLTKLADGSSYLVQGSNVTISTGSNGSVTISSTGGGAPGGSDTYVQFNDGGSFGGVADLAFNKTTKTLSLTGSIASTGSIFHSGSAAFGSGSNASGTYSFVAGELSTATGRGSIAGGFKSLASGLNASAIGYFATASGNYSSAEGGTTVASNTYSHAEGFGSTASGTGAHSEGLYGGAAANYSHTEGYFSVVAAGSIYSHAEGYITRIQGSSASGSHSEGWGTLINAAAAAHAEGYLTTGSANFSHAEGSGSITAGVASHAGGIKTIASGTGQTVYGSYNTRGNTTSLFVIGNGTADENASRNDVFRVENRGIEVTGSVYASLGLSGSLTRLHDGRSYLVAGSNVTITSESNGQVLISSTGGGGAASSYFTDPSAGFLNTTGSVAFAGSLGTSYISTNAGADVNFFSSGSIGTRGTSTPGTALFTGDLAASGTIYGLNGVISLVTAGGSTTITETGAGNLEFRNTGFGGTFVQSVRTSTGNTVNFLDVRPNGMAVNTKVAIMPSIYAGPANPFSSTDTNFFVGGLANSKGSTGGGTAVMGGDLVVSGSTYIGTSNSNSLVVNAVLASDIIPDGNRTRNLGSPDFRFANMYTGDLHLRNERGDWTIIEEPDFLRIVNNRTGKSFKMMMSPIE